MALRGHGGVHVEHLPLIGQTLVDVLPADGGAAALHRADGVVDKLRAQLAVDGHIVGDHVAHARQPPDDADAHGAHVPGRGRGGGEVGDKGEQLAVGPGAGVEFTWDARPQKGVGAVLAAVDALVDGQLQLTEVHAHGLIRLDQGQGQGQAVLPQGVGQVLALGVAEQEDQNAVRPLGVVAAHQPRHIPGVHRRAGKDELRRGSQMLQQGVDIVGLPPGDAREQGLVALQHQGQHAQARFSL